MSPLLVMIPKKMSWPGPIVKTIRLSLTLFCLTLFISACSTSKIVLVNDQAAVKPPQVSMSNWGIITGGREGNRYTGTRAVNLVRPVAVAAQGNDVYIVDASPMLLYHFDNTSGELSIAKDLANVVHGEVNDLFIAPDRSYYLADSDHVMHFDHHGQLIRAFQDRVNLGRPVSVVEHPATGWVYIADGFNDDVLVYNSAGQLQGAIGTRGDGEGQFRGITAMGLGKEGLNVATRFGQSRVQLMGLDRSFLYDFQQDTVTFPTALAVDNADRVFVSDFSDNTIRVYAGGDLVTTIGGTGSNPGHFKHITDLWFDNGLLYVADSLNSRVQIIRVVSSKP